MTAADFTEFLVAEIEAGNQTYVTGLLTAAKAKITAGGGEILPMVGASANGKSFNRELRMDCATVAKCCRDALIETAADDEDSGPVSATAFDFRCL